MPDLEISGLTKRFGSVQALTDMSFTVRRGEIFGFVGSNGAGKTTTMRIALGVLAADSGTVTFDGKPLDLAARRRVGYMPEERGLYPKMKVGEQLVYLARLHGMDVTEATAAMESWTERLGVAARRGDDVQKLSLGNQQRVQLAAALVHDPKLLVLDEPFSGLDPVAVNVMSEMLRERANEGVPVIFSSHQLDLVQRLCDRVGSIVNGSMRTEGTVNELRTRGPIHFEVLTPARGWLPEWARLVSETPESVLVEVDSVERDQELLQAALNAGPVHGFGRKVPDLTELFREVVQA